MAEFLADLQHLATKLPPPCPRDDDGFAHSFEVEDVDNIRKFFETYGYVVVRGVLDEDEVQQSRDEFFSQFDADNEESVTRFLNRFDNQLSHMGIIGIDNDTRSLAQLANRQNERVYKAFAAVYGVDQLIVDHDRLGAMRPTLRPDGTVNEEWQTVNNWLHMDCNPVTGEICIGSLTAPPDHRHDFTTEAPFLVHAVLALSDAREQDGGYLCVPGSHRITQEWTRLLGWDQVKFPGQLRPSPDDPLQHHIQYIPLRAGSLVIWNEFTLHANHPNRSDRWRVNQYLRMYPALTTQFRPYAPDASCYPEEFLPRMTPLGRKLFGLDPWDK